MGEVHGSTFLDIPGLCVIHILELHRKVSSLWAAGCRFSSQPGNNNLGQICPGGDQNQTGVLPPFCEATPIVFVSCGESIAQAAVQTTSTVERGFVPPNQGWRGDIFYLSLDQGGFYSHYFLATKRTGGFRPTLNVHGLNSFIRVAKFHVETLTSILQGLHKGWWMVSLDFKDANLHVLIHPSH